MTSTPIPSGFKSVPLERGVENGVEWFTYPAPLWGAVNGYAHLPEGHPWRDLDLQISAYDEGPSVHGGVTYGPTSDGWIGFDTLHAGDNWPDSPRYSAPTSWDREWTAEMVADEARSLARQIAEAVSS
jgi:hypothetical protein